MPGGGIKPHDVARVVEGTGCRQIHLTAFKTASDPSTRGRPSVTFGGALFPPEDQYSVTDSRLVQSIALTLKR